MKNGILGSGDVGRRLVDGETIKIGSRNPNQDKVEWLITTKQKYHQELLQKQLHLVNWILSHLSIYTHTLFY
jgi:hypothetical protein